VEVESQTRQGKLVLIIHIVQAGDQEEQDIASVAPRERFLSDWLPIAENGILKLQTSKTLVEEVDGEVVCRYYT